MAEQTSKNIAEHISKLTKLKDSLIKVVEDVSNTSELNQRFMQLSSEHKEDFELLQTLMLMQDINSTNQKNFKSSMISYIGTIINSKIENYGEMEKMNLRIKSIEDDKGIQIEIPIVGNVGLKDAIFFMLMVFTIVVTSYIVDPKATESSMSQTINTMKTKIGAE